MVRDFDAALIACKAGWFKARAFHVHGVIKRAVQNFVCLDESRILDYRCGALPVAAASFSIRYPKATVYGIDNIPIDNNRLRLEFDRLVGFAVPAAFRAMTIEAIGVPSYFGWFDCIYAWSAFSRTPPDELKARFLGIRNALRPRGVFFIQSHPLYYSPFGSELTCLTKEPWRHLLNSSDELREIVFDDQAPQSQKEAEWHRFVRLNRHTTEDIVAVAEESGLELVHQEAITVANDPPQFLLHIYGRSALTTGECRAVFRRA